MSLLKWKTVLEKKKPAFYIVWTFLDEWANNKPEIKSFYITYSTNYMIKIWIALQYILLTEVNSNGFFFFK